MGVEQLIFVGDRGMEIMYNLENNADLLELSEEHIDFITGLTHAGITSLITRGHIQLDLFKRDLAEVKVDNMRYILSINPELEARELFYLNNRIKRTDTLIEKIRKSYEKRCAQNEKNRNRQKDNQKKYKLLKTAFTVKDLDGYKRRVAFALKECGTSKYHDVKTIDNESFQVVFNRIEFDKSRSLCGKYVVCTSVTEQDMSAEQVRGQYKNLKHAEHAFRDLKSDNISIRPVYHRKEPQTRGHVQLCMFAYAILKEIENKLFPFLKMYNRSQKRQLSLNDLIAELNNIKMCELKIGNQVTSIQKPELNPLQIKIFDALKINPEKMMK